MGFSFDFGHSVVVGGDLEGAADHVDHLAGQRRPVWLAVFLALASDAFEVIDFGGELAAFFG